MAFYNLKKKPALTTKEGDKETMYADIVYSGTIPAERLIRGVAKRTGFKEGVIEGILMELKEDVLQYLGEGYRVELGEFGFFSAKVKASRLVANKNDIRSESVAFNGVNFRASKSMRVGIRGDLERRKCVDFNTSRKWDRENLKKLVLQYIREHGFITRTTYTELTGRLKNTALGDLKSDAFHCTATKGTGWRVVNSDWICLTCARMSKTYCYRLSLNDIMARNLYLSAHVGLLIR